MRERFTRVGVKKETAKGRICRNTQQSDIDYVISSLRKEDKFSILKFISHKIVKHLKDDILWDELLSRDYQVYNIRSNDGCGEFIGKFKLKNNYNEN